MVALHTGTTIWRVLIPVSSIENIPELTASTSWWHGPTGHVYHSFVDDPEEVDAEKRMFEISVRAVVNPETVKGKVFSWGIPATNERVEAHFAVCRVHLGLEHEVDIALNLSYLGL